MGTRYLVPHCTRSESPIKTDLVPKNNGPNTNRSYEHKRTHKEEGVSHSLNARDFALLFYEKYKDMTGDTYSKNSKMDCGIFSRLLKSRTPEQLEKKLGDLFSWAWENNWRSKDGERPTVRTFAAMINEMGDKPPEDNTPVYKPVN
jgi:hypothetical protein